MKEIKLTQGKVALVDDEDFDRLNQFKWFARRSFGTFYAIRGIGGPKRYEIRMHREILNAPNDMEVDHINNDGLCNLRANLRLCNRSQNAINRRKQKNNKSGYVGVSWHTRQGCWHALIYINNKKIHLGVFDSIVDAALAYDKAAIKYHGEFARPNFPNLSHSTVNPGSTPAAQLDASGTRPGNGIGGQLGSCPNQRS